MHSSSHLFFFIFVWLKLQVLLFKVGGTQKFLIDVEDWIYKKNQRFLQPAVPQLCWKVFSRILSLYGLARNFDSTKEIRTILRKIVYCRGPQPLWFGDPAVGWKGELGCVRGGPLHVHTCSPCTSNRPACICAPQLVRVAGRYACTWLPTSPPLSLVKLRMCTPATQSHGQILNGPWPRSWRPLVYYMETNEQKNQQRYYCPVGWCTVS